MWNVRSGTILAMYNEHNGRLFCVEWSLSDPDIILTGSDDHTVRVWRRSQHAWVEGIYQQNIVKCFYLGWFIKK